MLDSDLFPASCHFCLVSASFSQFQSRLQPFTNSLDYHGAMALSHFVQPVSDADEIQVYASTLPGNTTASIDWGVHVWASGLQAELLLMHITRELFRLLKTAGDTLSLLNGQICVGSPQEGWKGVRTQDFILLGMLDNQPVGRNKLVKIIPDMCKDAEIQGVKQVTQER